MKWNAIFWMKDIRRFVFITDCEIADTGDIDFGWCIRKCESDDLDFQTARENSHEWRWNIVFVVPKFIGNVIDWLNHKLRRFMY